MKMLLKIGTASPVSFTNMPIDASATVTAASAISVFINT